MRKFMAIFLLLALPAVAQKKPGKLTATATAHSVALAWTAPPVVTGETYVSVLVYRGGALLTTLPVATLAYTDTAVTAGTTYSYTLASEDSNNKISVQSAAVSATVPGGTTPPPTTCGAGGANIASLALSTAAPSVTFTIWDNCPGAEPATVTDTATLPASSSNIKLSAASGNTAFSETVTLVPGTLAAGTYKATIVAKSLFWTNTVSIPVTITITGTTPPAIAISSAWGI